MPLCWCESIHERIPFIVSSREECEKLEQHIKRKASVPVICYYED